MIENLRSEKPYNPPFNNYINPILSYISLHHLDIGCGNGSLSRYLSNQKPSSFIKGFDTDKTKINQARFHRRYNLDFTDSIKTTDDNFSSASCIFVFHEAGEDIFSTISKILHYGSFLSIVDYQLKNSNQSSFIEKFSSSMEKDELNQIGPNSAYQIHTRYDLSDCISMSEKYNFKTISNQIIKDKYFVWIGQN